MRQLDAFGTDPLDATSSPLGKRFERRVQLAAQPGEGVAAFSWRDHGGLRMRSDEHERHDEAGTGSEDHARDRRGGAVGPIRLVASKADQAQCDRSECRGSRDELTDRRQESADERGDAEGERPRARAILWRLRRLFSSHGSPIRRAGDEPA